MRVSGQHVYVSGPMTGLPLFNRPAFFSAEALLLAAGAVSVFNPARQPDGLSWDEYMRRDIAGLRDCTLMVQLPGWELSRGARLEHDLAVMAGMPVVSILSLDCFPFANYHFSPISLQV